MAKRKSPRISINKLAEYCIANPTRRKSIVEQAKNPPPYISARYSEARDAICEFLLSGDFDTIDDAINNLNGKKAKSKHAQNDIDCSIQALNIIRASELTELNGIHLEHFRGTNTLANIAGVDISVYPDLIALGGGGKQIGALKLHIAKDGLEEESLNIVAAFLYQYTQDYLVEEGQSSDRNLCFAFDVFSGLVAKAPKSIKQRMKRVESACEEIALRWDTI